MEKKLENLKLWRLPTQIPFLPTWNPLYNFRVGKKMPTRNNLSYKDCGCRYENGVFAWSFHSSALNKNFQHSSCKNLLKDTKPRVNLILFFYSSFWAEPGLPFVRHFNINFEKKISYVILWQTESIISGKFHIWLMNINSRTQLLVNIFKLKLVIDYRQHTRL